MTGLYGDIKGVHHTKREAYDHYLPKALYPFNSINFRNLAPACHECNSTYKLSKDPAHNASGRRKAFYPYATGAHGIEIAIDLNTPDIDRLTPADVQLAFGPAAVHEEIETWKEVYGIDERYKAKCCDMTPRTGWSRFAFCGIPTISHPKPRLPPSSNRPQKRRLPTATF